MATRISEVKQDQPMVQPARLRLLGTFELRDADGGAIAIGSQRAQSLLAYLALHRGVPQSRRLISFLLWPDSSETQARNNLRQLVHQLRQSWPDADRFLTAQASTLALQLGPALEVDTETYEQAAAVAGSEGGSDAPRMRGALERATGAYGGALLPGSYDDWIGPERDRLAGNHGRLLDRLVALLEEQGDYPAAIEHARRRLGLDPLDEGACRLLMRLHVLNHDRAEALRLYQATASLLERELGVEPDPKTRSAYEEIVRDDSPASTALTPWAAAGRVAPSDARPQAASEDLPLVGRRGEWGQIMKAWRRMVGGEAHLIVIGGEAGIGKSRLAAELSAWAGLRGIQSARARAYGAEGRLSYAPVADWLRSPVLAAALPRLDDGTLSEVSRLLPEVLLERPGLPRPSGRVEDWQRQPFFQALARAFLIADRPLVLILDDLQWCDADTLEWLHFLLRFDRHANVLVAATVRPDEIDRRHPLTRVVAELREATHLTEIRLGPLAPSETSALAGLVAGRRLRPRQVRDIHLETEGNPLFVVETVRAGLIGLESASGTTSGPGTPAGAPASRALPPRIQTVISARLGQLSEPARAVAAVAATVGRAFTLEVVREGSGVDEDVLVQGLDELQERQIVRELGVGAYDFAHDKIREVAYAEMTEARRRLLHRRVAEALERVHATGLDAVAAQIAAQYASAGLADRAAMHYQRAAEVAQRIGSNLEAISLLERGLALLEPLAPSHERDRRELELQVTLGLSLVATEGYAAPQVFAVYARARQLCQLVGEPPTPPILRVLAMATLAKPSIEECHALGDHLMSLAEHADDPVLRVEAHFVIAVAMLLSGAAVPARVQLEASLAHYDRARSATHISLYGQDPAVVCLIRLSLDLWLLGQPEASARRRAESLALAEAIGHPFTRAYALTWDAILASHRGDAKLARTQAEAAIGLSRELRMPFWRSIATVVHGWAVAEQDDVQAGIDEIRKGMADLAATGSGFTRPFHLGLLAEQYGRLGNVERGLTLIAEALALVELTNERWSEPELHRRRGELYELASSDKEAEESFRRSIGVAHYQGVQALELRSATRLAELWVRQQRTAGIAALIRPLVDRFGAATDAPDLAHARALLELADPSTIREPA